MTDLPLFGAPNEKAAALARGITRMFTAMNCSTIWEMTLANGRRADVAVLHPNNHITLVEIKTSLADFKADNKWPEYLDFCDRLFFAVPEDFDLSLLPEEAGIIIADRYGAEIVREAPEERLNAARRKAVTLRFAHLAASRLQRVIDPELPFGHE